MGDGFVFLGHRNLPSFLDASPSRRNRFNSHSLVPGESSDDSQWRAVGVDSDDERVAWIKCLEKPWLGGWVFLLGMKFPGPSYIGGIIISHEIRIPEP